MLPRVPDAFVAALAAVLILTTIALFAVSRWRRERQRVADFRAGLLFLARRVDGLPRLQVVRSGCRIGLIRWLCRRIRANQTALAGTTAVAVAGFATTVLLVAPPEGDRHAEPAPIQPPPVPSTQRPPVPSTVTVTVTETRRVARPAAAKAGPPATTTTPGTTAPASTTAAVVATSASPTARAQRPLVAVAPQFGPSSAPGSSASRAPDNPATVDRQSCDLPTCVAVPPGR